MTHHHTAVSESNAAITVTPRTLPRSYAVLCERGLRNKLADLVAQLTPRVTSLIAITDDNVIRLHGEWLNTQLQGLGIPFVYHVIPPHRNAKTLNTASQVFATMFEASLDKHSLVLNVGGGTVGDLGGLVAALYLRGVRHVHVPTTLISQADSGVGGKVNANFGDNINCISVFHHPAAVWIDPDFLLTLPPKHIRSGLSEIIKYSVVMNAAMFTRIESSPLDFANVRGDFFDRILRDCLASKCAIVQDDPAETEKFRFFNYGHELGHAIEVAYGYDAILHGEAVALGMCCSAIIGKACGITAPEVASRQHDLLNVLSLPTSLSQHLLQRFRSREELERAITAMLWKDKKRSENGPCWILPTTLGNAMYAATGVVEPALVTACIRTLASGKDLMSY